MFTALPQFIIVIALAAVVAIVLRRLPGVTVREDAGEEEGEAQPFLLRLKRLGAGAKSLALRLWKLLVNFVAEAKGHTIKANYAERFSKVLRLRGLRSRFPGWPPMRTAARPKISGLMSGGTPETIEQALIKTIEKNPANQEAYESLGKLYLEQKKFSDAKEVYEYLVNVRSPKDSYFSALGLVYFNLSAFDQAIEAYNKAIQLRPELPTRLINLSLCYEAKGQIGDAIASVEKALQISPDKPEYLLLLADFLVKEGQKREAKETLLKVLELEPSNQEASQKLLELEV